MRDERKGRVRGWGGGGVERRERESGSGRIAAGMRNVTRCIRHAAQASLGRPPLPFFLSSSDPPRARPALAPIAFGNFPEELFEKEKEKERLSLRLPRSSQYTY